MLASFMLLVDFNAVSREGVKFRGRACQRRDLEDLIECRFDQETIS
jgi:hypothetical protein